MIMEIKKFVVSLL